MFTKWILKIFVPDIDRELTSKVRNRCGIVSGIVGIICNLLLVIVKIALAVISGSLAMAADAVNNLSDAGSGIITVIGFRFSSQPPDAEHPFGHGRTEYIAGLIVALLIVSLGVSFLKDSVMLLFRPAKISVNTVGIIIFSATVLVKLWMFFFYRGVGKLINSDVIKAAAVDSLSDCLGTAVVIIALILARYTDFPTDACAGIIVALMILWAGGSICKELISKLLGEPPNREVVEKIRNTILESPGIDGVHDMIIHNYGENSYFVTAHAEISCHGDRFSAHDILENAEVEVARKLPVHLLLHADPYDNEQSDVILWRSRMENTLVNFDCCLKLYDFRLSKTAAGDVEKISFDLLIPRKYPVSEVEILETLQKKMQIFHSALVLDIRFVNSFV